MRPATGDWTSHGPDFNPPGPARSTSDALGERTFSVLGEDRFSLDAADLGVCLEVNRLRRERGSLIGELVVYCDLAGVVTFDRVLSSADIWLTNAKARSERARLLAERAGRVGIDFLALLEELALRIGEAERRGQPAVLLRDTPKPVADDTFDVEGFPVLRRHPLVLFGAGGAAKSLLLLWMLGLLALRGIRVALFDWELDAADHRVRLEQLFGPAMPAVLYVRCTKPLVHEADRLRRIIHDERLEFCGIDSAGFGSDGPPEAAEVALRFMNAVRSLQIGSLITAHVNKSERADEAPFGSSFWHNSARSTWFIKAAESQPGEPLTVGLYHKKSNLGRRHSAKGYTITFGELRTTIEPVDVAEIDGLAQKLPLRARIQQALRKGSKPIAELAEELEAEADSVKRTVNRYSSGKVVFFTKLSSADGTPRIALVDRGRS